MTPGLEYIACNRNSKHKMQNQNLKFKKLIQPKAGYQSFALRASRFKFSKGFTLIELIVYVAILGLISIFIADNLSQIVFAFNKARAEREVINNARISIETITKEIQEASLVYAPSSVFNSTTSQISLLTTNSPSAGHSEGYADIYTDNGRLYLKKEGSSALAITSNRVTVTQFRAEHIIQALNREDIKIILTVIYNTTSAKLASSATFNASVALRGAY